MTEDEDFTDDELFEEVCAVLAVSDDRAPAVISISSKSKYYRMNIINNNFNSSFNRKKINKRRPNSCIADVNDPRPRYIYNAFAFINAGDPSYRRWLDETYRRR